MPRLGQMHWGDLSKAPLDPFCAACGRPLKGGPVWEVHVYSDGIHVVHPDDWAALPEADKVQGTERVGPECRKRFGAFARKLG